jgi:intracellular sulfur oxidation DsrE/DsrF family protein
MRAVSHVSAADSDEQARTLGSVSNHLGDDSIDLDDLAVVVTGDAIEILAQGSAHDSRVVGLLEDVSFTACENSLDGSDVTASDLFDGVETVPSGVGELTRLQDAGYGYVRP